MHARPEFPGFIRSYRDLRVWQHAMTLVEASYQATSNFPPGERYGLVSQIRRAAVSVPSNIAEGHAKTLADYLRHITIARGSLVELETQLDISVRLGLATTDRVALALRLADEVGRMLSSLRRSLRRTSPPSPDPSSRP